MGEVREMMGLSLYKLREETRDRDMWRRNIIAVTRGRSRLDRTKQCAKLSTLIYIMYHIRLIHTHLYKRNKSILHVLTTFLLIVALKRICQSKVSLLSTII